MEHLMTRAHRSARLNLAGHLSRMLDVRRQRVHLSGLSEHRLKDIGVTKDEARAEAERPVWDVPATWRR